MQELYNQVLKLGCQLKHASDNAMVQTHAWGYNGFKRMHEVLCEYLDYWCRKLEKEMRDEHELSPALTHMPYAAYQVTDIKNHAHTWYQTIKDACTQISTLNTQMMQTTGKQSCIMKQFVNCLYKMKQIAWRFIKRGEHCQWMEHDIHVYDDRLHDKMKCIQKRIDKVMKKKWRH